MSAAAAYPSEALRGSLDVAHHDWQKPLEGADRSPCPALNTLANHNYFPRNGRNITDEQIRNSFTFVYGLGDDVSDNLLGTIKDLKNSDGNLDLNVLRAHNVLEHDASLVHDDTALGNNWVTNQTLVEAFIASSKYKKVLTLSDIGKWRSARKADSELKNKQFSLDIKHATIAYFEASVFYTVFAGDGTGVPLEDARSFLGKEQLPAGFVPKTAENRISTFNVAGNALRMRLGF